ncbi:MAG: SpoIIE family protein phosphatase [Butyrivibrio sp.]|nr:SpoIIE family protein phosphatase [Acetatifactor muris]MCM1561124.1 SpoIIE family protein phosphatase [Butyrivibrio sp.]
MKTVESELRTAQVSELCRKRLLNYADSFYELARSYDGSFSPETEDRQAILSERRIWENRQILKSHLQEMAKIMTDVAGEVLCYRPMEDRKRRLIVRAMREEGIRAENPCYITGDDGREAIVLTLSTGRKGSLPAEEAADMLSVLLNTRLQLAAGSPFMVEKEPHSYILEREARLVALTGFARVTEEDETISGDNYAVLEAERGKLTVMLSDGTGSGEQAAEDSGHVLDLMEKLLEAGYGAEAAVEMVNTALFVTGEDRNHPTLDVCSMNLYSGECEFRKVGGAAAFLKREGEVKLIAEGNLPLGVFWQTKIQPISISLKSGDYLFMMSDGVIDAFSGQGYESAVGRAIEDMQEQNPGELAERLLRMALIAAGGRVRDDMTIAVIGVWENHLQN